MDAALLPSDMSAGQQALWRRVDDLWRLAVTRDEAAIRAALHPRYTGWQINDPRPHDRETAVRSVTGIAPQVTGYELQPFSVQVYDERVGIVHYAYSATLAAPNGPTSAVSGRWTEVYLQQNGEWLLIAVSGRPDV